MEQNQLVPYVERLSHCLNITLWHAHLSATSGPSAPRRASKNPAGKPGKRTGSCIATCTRCGNTGCICTPPTLFTNAPCTRRARAGMCCGPVVTRTEWRCACTLAPALSQAVRHRARLCWTIHRPRRPHWRNPSPRRRGSGACRCRERLPG